MRPSREASGPGALGRGPQSPEHGATEPRGTRPAAPALGGTRRAGARLRYTGLRSGATGRLAAVLVAAGALGACTGSGAPARVTAAPAAGDPACGRALAQAPATVAGLARTPLAVAGARSWGEPPVVLRCGLPEQRPTTRPCLGVNGVDWVFTAEGEEFVFVSYGRAPAAELTVPARYGRDRALAAVTDVVPVAAALPRTGRACVGPGDVSASPAVSTPASAPASPPASSFG